MIVIVGMKKAILMKGLFNEMIIKQEQVGVIEAFKVRYT